MLLSSPIFCSNCGAANDAQDCECFACHQSLQPQALPSAPTLLRQRYHTLTMLGQGGMGAVYKAEDTELGNRIVALKEMSQRGLNQQESAEATRAFKREALLLAGLMHPNLPRIYDHFSENGRWYLVMDFIEGEQLEEHLAQATNGRLFVKEALAITLQLCGVLDYLHTRQPPIIFRDLKPSNIMLLPDGHIYLIDFGIARHFKPGQDKDTIALGSPGYAAPEQYGKAQTTPQADIYSLGAILHQMLTGNDPTANPFVFAPLPQNYNYLQSLLNSMLQFSAALRPASAAAVRQELQRLEDYQPSLPQSPSTGQWTNPYPVPTPPATVSHQPAQRQPQSQYIWHSSNTPPLYKPPVQFNSAPGTLLTCYQEHQGIISALAWSPHKGSLELASASYDNTVRIYNLALDRPIQVLHHNRNIWGTGHVRSIAWSPNGRSLATAGDSRNVLIWSVGNGKIQYSYEEHIDRIQCVAWSPDGELIASASEDTIHIWKSTTGTLMLKFSMHKGTIHQLAWSPDGTYLASAGHDGTVLVYDSTHWNQDSGRFYAYQGHPLGARSVCWSPNGTHIASSGIEGSVQIWNPTTHAHVLTYAEHNKAVNAVAWSPNGRYIASGSEDHNVKIWKTQNGAEVLTLSNDVGAIQAVAWSADGQLIASGGEDTVVRIWKAP